MRPAAVLNILVAANTKGASGNLIRLQGQLRSTQGGASSLGKALGGALKVGAFGAGAGMGYAISKAADFEQQLDSLGSVSGASGRQMEQFRKQAMKAGADTKFSALEAAAAQTELAKGGLRVRQIMKGGLRSALALAAAGEMDLADAAETTANAIKLFGLRGKDSMKVADALATAANRTTADVSDFALALKMGGSVAKLAGLSFNETVVALEALAEAGIKGSDAGTSLKSFFLNIATPSAKAAEAMDELGLNIFTAKGDLKSLPAISKNLRSAFGDLTKEQFLNKAGTIAGSDAVRTLYSLYAAGPAKLDKLAAATSKHGSAADVAAKKQDNLKGKLENLQGSIETAAIAIGTKMLPTLTRAAEEITDVINDPKLTASEKLDKFGKMLSDALTAAGPVVAKAAGKVGLVAVRAFFNAFRDSPLWLKLLTAGFIISKLGGFGAFRTVGAAGGAAMAGGIARGAAKGAAGGTIAGRFKGLAGAFRRVGQNVLGAALLAGVADAATRQGISGFGDRFQQGASTATLGLIPAPNDVQERLQSIAKQIQQYRGSGLLKLSDPNDPDNSLIRQKDLGDFTHRQKVMLEGMAELRNTANQLFGQNTRLLPEAWSSPKRTQRDLRMLINEFGRMRSGAVTNVGAMRSTVDDQLKRIGRSLGFNTAKGKAAVKQNFTEAAHWIRKNMSDGKGLTDRGTAEMARLMKVHTNQGKNGLKGNMDDIIRVIARTMRRGGRITDEGTAMIRQSWIKELRLYGLNPRTVLNRPQEGTAQQIMKQRGGPINLGKVSGDSVPAMLERGEYVLNRNAVRKVGRKALDQVNFASAPRFQAGGMIDPAWDPGSERLAASISGKVGSWAKRYDANMTAGYDPGGGHLSPGHNVTGTATDMVPLMGDWDLLEKGLRVLVGSGLKVLYGSNGVGTPWPDHGRGNHAHIEWGGAGGLPSFAPKLKRIIVGGPDSALKGIVQSGLDKTRSGAQKTLNAAVGTVDGTGGVSGFSGPWVQVLEQIAKAKGWSARDWKSLVQGESGGDPTARNPSSGAFGLGQFLGGTLEAYRQYGAGSTDPARQIQAMAKYIEDRYGNPSNAYNTWLSRSPHWYAGGGAVGLSAGAPPGGKLGKRMHSVLQRFGSMDKKGHAVLNRKQRGKLLRGFLERVKGVGLPTTLNGKIASLTENAEVFGDYADRAGQLTLDTGEGDPIQGIVNELTEAQWLEKQLQTLFELRNKLIKAHDIVVRKREAMSHVIEAAQKRLGKVAEHIRSAAKVKRGYESQLEKARKHPKKNAALIKDLKAKIRGIDHDQGFRLRERNALKGRILPALGKKRSSLNTARGDTLTALDEVQGAGSPMGHLGSLPAVGVLGGTIFAAQMRLRELNAPKPSITDTSADSGALDMERELRRIAEQRLAVSEAQSRVFQGTGLPFMGAFAEGGLALVGENGPELAHMPSGTRVHSAADTQSMLEPSVSVIVNGSIIQEPGDRRDPVEVVIGDRRFEEAVVKVNRSAARRGGRPLPGGAGGLRKNG